MGLLFGKRRGWSFQCCNIRVFYPSSLANCSIWCYVSAVRNIASAPTAQKTPLPIKHLLVPCICRRGNQLSWDVYRAFPRNCCICWSQNSGFEPSCHNTYVKTNHHIKIQAPNGARHSRITFHGSRFGSINVREWRRTNFVLFITSCHMYENSWKSPLFQSYREDIHVRAL
jgi:hypothetical protein